MVYNYDVVSPAVCLSLSLSRAPAEPVQGGESDAADSLKDTPWSDNADAMSDRNTKPCSLKLEILT